MAYKWNIEYALKGHVTPVRGNAVVVEIVGGLEVVGSEHVAHVRHVARSLDGL